MDGVSLTVDDDTDPEFKLEAVTSKMYNKYNT